MPKDVRNIRDIRDCFGSSAKAPTKAKAPTAKAPTATPGGGAPIRIATTDTNTTDTSNNTSTAKTRTIKTKQHKQPQIQQEEQQSKLQHLEKQPECLIDDVPSQQDIPQQDTPLQDAIDVAPTQDDHVVQQCEDQGASSSSLDQTKARIHSFLKSHAGGKATSLPEDPDLLDDDTVKIPTIAQLKATHGEWKRKPKTRMELNQLCLSKKSKAVIRSIVAETVSMG